MTPDERTAALENIAVEIDRGWAGAAVAAIGAAPPGPQHEYEIAWWAKRIARESSCSAIVVPEDCSDERAIIIATLIVAVQIELGGGS